MRSRLHLKERCRTTGKRSYREALDVLIANMGNPRTIRAYVCPFCGHWHATSKPAKSHTGASGRIREAA